MERLIERLRSLAKAYPKDVFPVLTKEQTWAHPEIVARAGASMGRHFSTTFTEAADEIERLRKDAERYRFCVERNTMPVIAGDGETWCMFLAVKSSRRSLFTGATPSEAVDAAMAGANI